MTNFIEKQNFLFSENEDDNETLLKKKKKDESKKTTKFGFSWKVLKQMARLYKIIFSGSKARFWINLFLIIGLISFSIVEEIIGYFIGKIPSKFYLNLLEHNESGFNGLIKNYFVLVILISVVKTIESLFQDCIGFFWRFIVTQDMHKKLFSQKIYYRLIYFDKRIDNPDQRIGQDIPEWVTITGKFLKTVLSVPGIIIYYSYKSYYVIGFTGLASFYLLFLVSFFITKIFMSPVVNLTFQLQVLEGNFRYLHVLVRKNIEQINFFRGIKSEKRSVDKEIKEITKKKVQITKRHIPLNLNTTLFAYFSTIVSYIVIGILVFNNKMKDQDNLAKLGSTISLCSFYFIEIAFGFTQFFDLSASIADMFSHTVRIVQMYDVIEDLSTDKERSNEQDQDGIAKFSSTESSSTEDDPNLTIPLLNSSSKINEMRKIDELSELSDEIQYMDVKETKENEIEYTKVMVGEQSVDFLNVDCYTPDNHLFAKKLKFSVAKPNQSLLITGSSGTGKTSIIRILGGLWKGRNGIIRRPKISTKTMMILCQEPYLPISSLRDQITYPKVFSTQLSGIQLEEQENEVEKILRLVGLRHLIDQKINSGKCETVSEVLQGFWDLNKSLSPGEKQRISLGRIIYHKPRFAILDESTSALETDTEKKIYLLLRKIGITIISIGHRDSLDEFHDQKLILQRNGNWRLEKIENFNEEF
ncbi:atp-binding cassette sub-family d member [Anaeramoeba flamelloides]|uniref:Atp-binding cassette sub-family d member n=1 Tax=Anaeramoeba flamelloides TaxID=1746091 RepID=A0AAV7ZDG4_9EUKA|nr:atp-binding cassette sub-family d member [Anaeramoeba flamelloides]